MTSVTKWYFGHLMQRVDSLEKTLMLGGIGGRRRRGWQRVRWLDGITDSMEWVLVNSGRWWWTGRPGVLQFMGSQRVGNDWVNELNWTERQLTNTTQDSGHVSFCYTDHYGKKWQNLNGIWRLDSSDYPLTYWFWWLNHSHVGKCPCLQETALLWGMMDHHIAIYFKLTSICYSCSVFFLSLRLLQWYIKCEKLIIIYNLVTWITEKQNLAKFRSLFFYQGSLICTYVDEYLYILLIYIYVLENKH